MVPIRGVNGQQGSPCLQEPARTCRPQQARSEPLFCCLRTTVRKPPRANRSDAAPPFPMTVVGATLCQEKRDRRKAGTCRCPDRVAQPVRGVAGAAKPGHERLQRLQHAGDPLSATKTTRRLPEATPARSAGATKSNTLAISSTCPGVGRAHCSVHRAKGSRSTGTNVSSATGTSEPANSSQANVRRCTSHAPTKGPSTMNRPSDVGDIHGRSSRRLVNTRGSSAWMVWIVR